MHVAIRRRRQPVKSREIVSVDIETLASSPLFEEGVSLSVDILGQDAKRSCTCGSGG